ncbi:GNAT superfamily N-acetyltransferase [Bradyrhizobium sp. BR13661]|nr:GNAT superfamily N-acetyltransferase [Bradyrhizobium sp. BR13661]
MVMPTHLDPDWTIRPFRRGDAPEVRRLIESVWCEHFQDHPDPFVRDFIYSRLSDVDNADSVYADRALFLCAIAEGAIVGTGAIKRFDDRECEMVRMFVAPVYRGRGIARTIADRLVSFAGNAGYDRIRLASNNALTASHRLYERMGFQLTAAWDAGGEVHSRHYVLKLIAS